MSAASLLPFEDQCGICLALLHSGRCPVCDLVPVKVSPATPDLAALLTGAEPQWAGTAYVVITPMGEITLRAGEGDLRLDVERFGGAVASALLNEVVTLDLVTDLLLILRHGAEGLWANGRQDFPLPTGLATLSGLPAGVRLTVDRMGGAVAWVDLDRDAVGDLAAQLMLSLRRRHWGAA